MNDVALVAVRWALYVDLGLLFGLLAAVAVGVLFARTFIGFQLKVLGQDERAAAFAGFPAKRLTLLAFILAGALAGVVVNDSLVLVDAANEYRAQGMSAEQAIREAIGVDAPTLIEVPVGPMPSPF